MAELKNMAKVAMIVIVLGIVIVMGLAVLGGFSEALRDSTTVTNAAVVTTLAAANTSANIVTGYPYAQSITSCTNISGEVYVAANYTFVPGDLGNEGVGTFTLINTDKGVGSGLNCTIVYLASTDEQVQADLFITGVGIFGTFMGIIVLAIVSMIVIGLFKGKGKQGL